MWFDVAAALATVDGGETAPDLSVMTERKQAKVAGVARIAAPVDLQLDEESAILAAILTGVQRPGAIATATKIGATRIYQLLDLMRDAGRIKVARDGSITAKLVS